MSKAAASSRKANAIGGPEGYIDDKEASPLFSALRWEPNSRQADAVQEALDWWIQSLPASGHELAEELRAPGSALFTAFRRGRLAGGRGHVLQVEGEEVRHYTIILTGRVRLRCRAPAPKTGATPARAKAPGVADEPGAVGGGDGDAAGGAVDEDGVITCGILARGEPLGLYPGDARAPWDAVCSERTAVLLLGAEDYAATLRPFHRELQAQTVDFLQRTRVCPQATPYQLHRVAPLLRHRRVRRGTVLLKAGDSHRSIYVLREGRCSLLSPPQERAPREVGGPEDEASDGGLGQEVEEEEMREQVDDDMEEEHQRVERMRALVGGGAAKQQAAAEEKVRKEVLAKYARGQLGKSLRGETAAKPPKSLGVVPRRDGLVATAVMNEPGTVLGEEVLLYDSFRELAAARCCYSIVAEEDCLLYHLDLTAFQKLASLIGADIIAEKTKGRLTRHLHHHTHGRRVAGQLTKETRRIQQKEIRKQERQMLRLPPSYAGADPMPALENTDDWLQVVFDHRKAPKNDKSPGTLQCLEELGIDVLTFHSGPGVAAMLKAFNTPTDLRQMRSGLRWRSASSSRLSETTMRNPMGDTIPGDAKYAETAPPGVVFGMSQAQAALPCGDEDADGADGGMGGIFFQTELDETAPPPPPPRASLVPPGPPPTSAGSSVRPRASLAASSSVPALPRLGSRGSGGAGEADDVRPSRGSAGSGRRLIAAGASGTREAAINRAFNRAVAGKSILVFTDKADARKAVMRAAQGATKEVDLCFVKSVTDMWQQLASAKEQYHAMMLDLTKNELQVDSLLKALRAHTRYGRLPIVVLAEDRGLSETVRASCSFVVFQPLSATMLREALLWCLDRKALEHHTQYEVPGGSSPGAAAAPKAIEAPVSPPPPLRLTGAAATPSIAAPPVALRLVAAAA